MFDRAIELSDEERADFVREVAGDDAVLREELGSLLAAHESAAGYFDDLADKLISPAYTSVIDAAQRSKDAARRSKDAALLPRVQAALAPTYRILEELGGGMSRVFLAEDLELGRRVVIKVLRPETSASASAERFRREIQLAAQLQHSHIVPLLTSGSADPLLYYTMPFVAGESLRSRLAREGPLPLQTACRIWRDMLDGLAHAHANYVVHRDIKPANVLLGAGHALISDFGIARAVAVAGGAHTEAPDSAIGTPAYMAPEQLVGDGRADHRSDIYAAGLVMHEMLDGELPFCGDTAREVMLARLTSDPSRVSRPDCPKALADLVARCLERDPAARPQTAAAVLAELDEIGLVRSPVAKRVVNYGLAALVLAAAGFGASRFLIERPGVAPAAGNRGSRSAERYTPSMEAYEWYQRGMDLALMRSSAGAQQAREYLNRAIAADSGFSAAHAGLARVYLSESGEVPGNHRESYALAEQAALKAVALDDSLAEAHVALGWALSVQWEWARAEEAFRRAIALDARAPRALEGLARVYLWTGRLSDQLAAATQAMEVEPFSHSATRELALALAMNGRCDEAVERLRPSKTLSPPAGVAGVVSGQCFAADGRWQEAIDELRWAIATGEAGTALAFLGYALARADQGSEATTILSDLLAGRAYSHGAFGIATVYAGFEDYDAVFVWLDRAVEENSMRPYLMGPMFQEVRRDARFAGVRARMGI